MFSLSCFDLASDLRETNFRKKMPSEVSLNFYFLALWLRKVLVSFQLWQLLLYPPLCLLYLYTSFRTNMLDLWIYHDLPIEPSSGLSILPKNPDDYIEFGPSPFFPSDLFVGCKPPKTAMFCTPGMMTS